MGVDVKSLGTGRLRASIGALCLLTLSACGSGNEVILEGERLAIRQAPEVTGPLSGDNLPKLSLPKAVSNSDWTHENGNIRHSAGHVAGEYPLAPVWSQSIGKGASSSGRITSGPIVANRSVFTMDTEALVTAFSTDGARLWSQSLILPGEAATDGFGGGLSFGSDVLVAGTGFGEVIALEPETGEILWRQKLDAPVRAAPTVANGVAYVVSRNDQAFAIDLKNGRIRWRIAGIDPAAGVLGGASPAIADGLAILPFASGEVVATIARNGRRAWTSVISGGRRGHVRARLSDITGDPVVSGNTIYVANQSGRLVALDRRTGDRLWSANDGSLGPALPVGRSLFFVNDEAVLKRLNSANGQEIWSVQLPQFEDPEDRKGVYLHSSPILMGGRLLVASSDGALRSFDPQSGQELGSTQIEGDGAAAQPAVAQGRLFVVSRDGTIFAFQ